MSTTESSWEAAILAEIQKECNALIALARMVLAEDSSNGRTARYDELVAQLEKRIAAIPEQARDRVLVRILGAFALQLNTAERLGNA